MNTTSQGKVVLYKAPRTAARTIETRPFASAGESEIDGSASRPASGPGAPRRSRRLVGGVAALLAFFAVALGASPASAAAYTTNVYAPHNVSGYAEGWATVAQDCSGTNGCWNYMKIEKWGWVGNSWIGGNWVTGTGWRSMSAALPSGCGYYRTTVDSYNDVTGPVGGGINIGKVGVSWNGQIVYRYKTTWSSGWAYLCH